MTRRRDSRQNLALGLGAGLLAGALAGGLEVAWLVVYAGGLDSIAALAYAVLACGLPGALVGLVLGLLLVPWQRPARPSDRWCLCLSLTAAALLAPIAAYRASADWQLGVVGQTLAAGLALLVGLGLFLALRWLTRRSRRWDRLARLPGSVVVYLTVVLAALLLSNAPGWLAHEADQGISPDLRDKPNVVVVVADALRADRLSCYDVQAPRTFHVDALAGDGVLYRNMSAQASWTKPSVATILTSMYPSSHQAIHSESRLPAAVTTLAETLSAAGYRTAGVTTNAYATAAFGFDQGFDSYVYLAPDDPFFAPQAAARLTVHRALMWLHRKLELGRWQRQTLGAYPGAYYREAQVVNRHVLSWLEAHRDERFFLYVHYMDPHTPYFQHPFDGVAFMDALPPDQAPWVKGLYDGEVAYLDAHLGELFDALKGWGLYEDTLIVFTSDHGEEFFEHGGWGHGATLYEEQLRVPLVVKYPGGAGAGTVDEGPARSLDVAPTVLDVLGLPVPKTMQGVSLRPGTSAPRASTLFAETVYQGYAMQSVRVGSRKLILTAPGHPRLTPPMLLFDLGVDAGEHRDLAMAESDAVRSLQAELDRVAAWARARAVAGQSGPIDPATLERLRNLGY